MENLHNGKSQFHTHKWIKYTYLNLQLYLKIRTFYRTKMVQLYEISKILMVRAHIDKVKSPVFHFEKSKSATFLIHFAREAVRLVYS